MELIFVRHGLPQTIDTDRGQTADPSLSATGREQAANVASWLADVSIDAIYVSPMHRALQTAEPLTRAVGHEPIVRVRLSEYDRHATTYIPNEDLKAIDPEAWDELVATRFMAEVPDPQGFMADVVAEVETIIGDHPGDVVAVVCHGGVINAYLAHLSRHRSVAVLAVRSRLLLGHPRLRKLERNLSHRLGQRMRALGFLAESVTGRQAVASANTGD